MAGIDENEGKGGSYVVDPKSGKRKLVERTQEKSIVPQAQTVYTDENSDQTSGDQ